MSNSDGSAAFTYVISSHETSYTEKDVPFQAAVTKTLFVLLLRVTVTSILTEVAEAAATRHRTTILDKFSYAYCPREYDSKLRLHTSSKMLNSSNMTQSGNTPNSSNAAPQAAKMTALAEEINLYLGKDLLVVLIATAGVVFAFRCIQSFQRRQRLLACLHSDTQHFFSKPLELWSLFKYHLLYAPLLQIRHSSSGVLGQLPTRLQGLFLTAIIAANTFLCFYDVPYRDPEVEVLSVLRARSGTIAVTNLIPITIMASVKNPLIRLLNISYDSFNLLHRWFARIAIMQAAMHATCHICSVVQIGGWSSFTKSTSDQMIWTGLVTLSVLILILLQSPSILRRAFYETFLHVHIVLAVTVLVFVWMHLDHFSQQRHLLFAAIILWAVSRALRLGALFYRSSGERQSTATLEALPGDMVRITITPSRPWNYKPGQYIYLTIPSVCMWTAHPFSIAWSDTPDPTLRRKGSIGTQSTTEQDVEKAYEPYQTFSLVIRARDGFTKRLFAYTLRHTPASLGHRVSVRALVEGPYGPFRSLDSYGNVLLITGGVGITHHLGHVRHLLQGYNEGIVATRKITLVWVVRYESERRAVEPWMDELMRIEARREVLRVEFYVTRGTVGQIRSNSGSVSVHRGRPDLDAVVKREGDRRIGCLWVSVCGPGGLQDDVRRIVRREIKVGRNIEFVAESFGW